MTGDEQFRESYHEFAGPVDKLLVLNDNKATHEAGLPLFALWKKEVIWNRSSKEKPLTVGKIDKGYFEPISTKESGTVDVIIKWITNAMVLYSSKS
jgi:hypothetical protein